MFFSHLRLQILTYMIKMSMLINPIKMKMFKTILQACKTERKLRYLRSHLCACLSIFIGCVCTSFSLSHTHAHTLSKHLLDSPTFHFLFQDVKTKFGDKANLGFPVSDSRGRLQVKIWFSIFPYSDIVMLTCTIDRFLLFW